MRKMPYLYIVLIVIVLFPAACKDLQESLLDTMIDLGTHRLHLYCTGQGSPAVVIETGFGEIYESWLPLMEEISQGTQVCAYDRAGYGQSELGPLPRDSATVAAELYKILEVGGIRQPYLLVGHSLGAYNVQVFAASYPEKMTGMVLLDPPPLDWLIGLSFPELRQMYESEQTRFFKTAAEEAKNAADPEQQAQAGFFEMLASESEQLMRESALQVAGIESFGGLPLVVIAASEANPAFGEAYQAFWIEQSRRVASKSTQGKFILAEGSSHHIHQDAPELVLSVVAEMLGQVR